MQSWQVKKNRQIITTSGRNNLRFTSDIRIECELLQKVLSEAHSLIHVSEPYNL